MFQKDRVGRIYLFLILLTSPLTTHWFFPVARCIIVESIGVAIMDVDSMGIIKQHSQSIWSMENNGGSSKNADSVCTNESVTKQHNQNCIQFHRFFM